MKEKLKVKWGDRECSSEQYIFSLAGCQLEAWADPHASWGLSKLVK